MPPLADLNRVRAILETDRVWSAYALADLEPAYARHASWHVSETEPALALIYRAFPVPVLVTIGEAAHLQPVLEELDAVLGDVRVFVVVQPEVLPLLRKRFQSLKVNLMQRMSLRRLEDAPRDGVCRLGPADLGELQALYADGEAAGEAPDFFAPEMLQQGVYRGVREGNELVAVAGTHVIADTVGVGAVGNIYTRRDRRNRGHATRATAAVSAELLARRLRTIVLNVRKDNAPAIHAYKRVGYEARCDYYEGVASRGQGPVGDLAQ